jgi:hypothetical protein
MKREEERRMRGGWKRNGVGSDYIYRERRVIEREEVK